MGRIFAWIKGLWESKKALGQRADKAAVDLPGDESTETTALFTVAGGRVLLKSLIGQVTVKPVAGTSQTVKLQHTPTTGAESATDMCGGLAVTDDIVDTLYTITGKVDDAMVDDAGAGVAVPSFGTNKQILQPGTIKMHAVNVGGSGAGAIKWTLHYIPIDEGAVVTAA